MTSGESLNGTLESRQPREAPPERSLGVAFRILNGKPGDVAVGDVRDIVHPSHCREEVHVHDHCQLLSPAPQSRHLDLELGH